jgi:hypothetical protein
MVDILKNLKLKDGLTEGDCLRKINDAIHEDFVEDDVSSGEIVYIAIGNEPAEKLFNELFEGATFQDYKDYFDQDGSWEGKACDIAMMLSYMPILSDDVYYSVKKREFYIKLDCEDRKGDKCSTRDYGPNQYKYPCYKCCFGCSHAIEMSCTFVCPKVEEHYYPEEEQK